VSNLDAFLYDLTPDLSDDPSLLEPNPFHITSDGASGRDTRRTVDGWTFVMNAADVVPANWGDGDAVLWAEGEGLTIAGPDGVGKTSVGQQLALRRIGLGSTPLLGLPVQLCARRLLYLAMDRPAQAARSLHRMVSSDDKDVLSERLVVHRGPLPFDILKEPAATLREFVESHGASDLVVDSLKDLAIGLSKDEVGSAINRAFQELSASGIEHVALHHQRKEQQGAGRSPKSLADVYGSRWLTAGMGSVVLLWGDPGDLVVAFRHLKQPVEEVGPFNVLHDHVNGSSSIHEHADLETLLARSADGLTVKDAARLLFEKDDPKANDIEKARRRLEGLVAKGRAERRDDPDGLARYFIRDAA
jgi:replicative DNA helicase